MSRRTEILSSLDWITIGVYFLLVILGILTIYSTTFDATHPSIFGLSTEYGRQFMWAGVSLIALLVILNIEGEFFTRFSFVFYGISLVLLLLVFVIGKEINGAKAWIRFGAFSIQPAEFAKTAASLAVARYLTLPNIALKEINTKLMAFAIIGLPAGIILLQPDTGTMLVFVFFILVMYREGLSGNILLFGFLSIVLTVVSLMLKDSSLSFFGLGLSGQMFLAILVLIGTIIAYLIIANLVLPRHRKRNYTSLAFVATSAIMFIFVVNYAFETFLQQHQKTRIEITLGLKEDPQGTGYNINQAKTAIGSGGWTGKGFKEGVLTRYNYVPEQETDFIFCTVGEEFGFIGTSLVVSLFVFLLIRIIMIAERQRSAYSRIYGYCVASIILAHFLINIGMVIGLAPVIGIPLPFFSSGGSSLLGFTILIFILLRLDAERYSVLR